MCFFERSSITRPPDFGIAFNGSHVLVVHCGGRLGAACVAAKETVGASWGGDTDDPYAYREIPRASTLGLSGSSGLNGKLMISGKVVFTQDVHTDTANIPIRLMQRDPNSLTMQELDVYPADPSSSYQFRGVSRGE